MLHPWGLPNRSFLPLYIGALIGAGILGTLGLITSLGYVESEGGGAGKMIVFTAGSAFVGFILGAIVAGTGK